MLDVVSMVLSLAASCGAAIHPIAIRWMEPWKGPRARCISASRVRSLGDGAEHCGSERDSGYAEAVAPAGAVAVTDSAVLFDS